MPGQRTLLWIGPAAGRTGITAKRLRAVASSGQIPVDRLAKGRERLFDPADVDRLERLRAELADASEELASLNARWEAEKAGHNKVGELRAALDEMRTRADLAEREGVEIRYYAIIYDLLDDMKGVLSGMLAPLQRETFLGNAAVLQVFDISKTGKIAGCRVSEGVVRKGAKVRIIRDDVVVLELGTLTTLKRFKDEVNEVPSGQECGMHFQGFQDIKAGDYIECFTVEEIKRTLD